MRLRTTAAAALGALALVVSLPGSANAATAEGQFAYTYTTTSGHRQAVVLLDPPSRECVTLPGVADPNTSEPADTPWNNTGSTATVFTGPDCDGAHYTLRPDGGRASSRLKLRSVVFS
ncbi:hypothetical protein AB0I93_07015 [Streptomyces sp. NPDC049967]|uniref:hypothetical protein n=1 Tax=Streptomyces sp. NPDC049967 TaxID=3155658 RepID=UPI0034434DF1